MSDLQMIVAPKMEEQSLALTSDGNAMVEHALERAALIGKVTDEVENSIAAEAQKEIKATINQLEKARVEMTKPFLDAQRKIKAYFETKASELNAEMFRVGKLATSYGDLLLAKARAEEHARNAELTRLEKEREAALAKVTSHEERDAVQEHFNERAAIESAPVAPVNTVAGQSFEKDYEVTVTDVYKLYVALPHTCKCEPSIPKVKAFIRQGGKPPGVTWREVTKQVIRAPSSRPVIDV